MDDQIDDNDGQQIQGYNLIDFDPKAEDMWKSFEQKIVKWRPSGAELKQRWFRHRFTDFVRKRFRDINQKPPKPLGSEEVFFRDYPFLKDEWEVVRKRAESVEPTEALKIERWMKQRKYEFMKNYFKKHRSDDAFNIRNEKYFKGDVGVVCNFRSNFRAFQTFLSVGTVIFILIAVICFLWKTILFS